MFDLGDITATITGPRRKTLFPKAARPAAPCATYCYHAILGWADLDIDEDLVGRIMFRQQFQ